MTLESFILAFILWLDPVMNHVAEEDPIARLVRMKAIATDMAAVCQDQSENPVFEGADGRIKTCLMLASIARAESGFKEAVDLGIERGDGGKSVCIMQVQHGKNSPMHPPAEQLKDRRTCIRAALNVLRSSKCNKGSDLNNMLRGYVSGKCEPRDDPKEDRAIARTAYADAEGYIRYFKNVKKLPNIDLKLVLPLDLKESKDTIKTTEDIVKNIKK